MHTYNIYKEAILTLGTPSTLMETLILHIAKENVMANAPVEKSL